MDDTFVSCKTGGAFFPGLFEQPSTPHRIYNQHKGEWCLTFLMSKLKTNNCLKTPEYRKPTYIGFYKFHFNYYNLTKKGIMKTLLYAAKIFCSTPNALRSEIQNLKMDLLKYGYLENLIDKPTDFALFQRFYRK